MKVLVTGAAGQIGSATVRHLHAQGYDVRATDMRLGKDLPVDVEVANLIGREACYPLMKGMDALVHLGNIPNGWGRDTQTLVHDNVTNNVNVFQAAAEAGVRKIVFASTIQVISGHRHIHGDHEVKRSELPYLPLDGEVRPNPGNGYALSKQLTEEMLRYFCKWNPVSAVAVRLPWTGRLEWLNHDHGDDWGGNPDEAFAYLEQNDAARLFEAILKAELPGFRIYFPSGQAVRRKQSVPELVEKYYAGVPVKKDMSGMRSLIDITRITQETGWVPKH